MTIDQLIRALGGLQKVSEAYDGAVTRQAIYGWVKRGVVPEKRRPVLLALAASERLAIPKEIQ